MVSNTISNFKREGGISLETLQQKGPHLAMTGEPRGFSRVTAGFLSYDWEFREPLIGPREVQTPFELRGGAWDFSQVTAGQIDSSRLVSINSVFLSGGDRDLGVAFKVHLGSQASSRMEAKNSALLARCDGYLLEPNEWPKGSQASCAVLREDSGLLSRPRRKRRASSHNDGGISWIFSSCGATCGVYLELRWGYQGASRVSPGKSSLHSSCEGEHSIALESLQGK